MTQQKKKRTRHTPERTCVGCRQVLPKRSLIRIVRTPQGVLVDPVGKAPGRGAYLHDQRACWQTALKGSLANALKVEISPHDRENLVAFMVNLPDDNTGDKQDINVEQ
jgi:predicted RNA-binding protein YlxR (DUF448 family)